MTEAIEIRRANSADAEALSLLGQATFLETYAGQIAGSDIVRYCSAHHAPALYQNWLAQADHVLFLAQLAKAPVGYMQLCTSGLSVAEPRADDLEIKRIYVLHRFQHRKLGAQLLELAVREAQQRASSRLLLGCYAKNERALGFYRRMGFTLAGTRKFRVGATDCDDVILAKELTA